MSDEEDPLEGADVGETRHVERSKHFHGINFEPREFYGSDRLGDATITNIEIVEGDDGECDDFVVTWESDMTKTLPRRWDSCREPRTAEEEAEARKRKWSQRAAKAAGLAIPMAIAVVVADLMLNATDLTVNGTTVGPPSPVGLVVIFGLILLTAAIMPYLPGMAGGVHR